MGELQGAPEGLQQTESKDDAEARADFWSIQCDFIYRHHNEPRVQLYVPKEETFLLPPKYIDVTRATYTNLDAVLMNIGMSMWISVCQIHGQDSRRLHDCMKNLQKDFSGPESGIHKFKQLTDLIN